MLESSLAVRFCGCPAECFGDAEDVGIDSEGIPTTNEQKYQIREVAVRTGARVLASRLTGKKAIRNWPSWDPHHQSSQAPS